MNLDRHVFIIGSGESMTVEFKQSFNKEAIKTCLLMEDWLSFDNDKLYDYIGCDPWLMWHESQEHLKHIPNLRRVNNDR